jgi:hypothetical protein
MSGVSRVPTRRRRSQRVRGLRSLQLGGRSNRTSAASTPPRGKPKVTIWATGKDKRRRNAAIRKLRRHARRRNWTVDAQYSDVGGSAVGLAALLRAFHRGEIRIVLVVHLTDIPLTSLSIGARLLSLADLGAVRVFDTFGDTDLASQIGRNACLYGLWAAAEIMEERLASLTGKRTVSAALQALTKRKMRRPRAAPSPRQIRRQVVRRNHLPSKGKAAP